MPTQEPVDRAITGICNAVMSAFVRAIAEARPGSPLLAARAEMGEDAFLDCAVSSMCCRVKDLLAGDRRAELNEWLKVPGAGEALFVADVIAGTLQDVQREAGLKAAE